MVLLFGEGMLKEQVRPTPPPPYCCPFRGPYCTPHRHPSPAPAPLAAGPRVGGFPRGRQLGQPAPGRLAGPLFPPFFLSLSLSLSLTHTHTHTHIYTHTPLSLSPSLPLSLLLFLSLSCRCFVRKPPPCRPAAAAGCAPLPGAPDGTPSPSGARGPFSTYTHNLCALLIVSSVTGGRRPLTRGRRTRMRRR